MRRYVREQHPRSKQIRGSLFERIWAKIVLAENGCWLWTASLDETGHAQLTTGKQCIKVHRWTYEYYREPIPEGKELHHECLTPSCVNPWHVEPKTALEHRAEHAKTHCVAGHEFTEENTLLYTRKDGHSGRMIKRICRACSRARTDAYNEQNKSLIAARRRLRQMSVARISK